VARVFGRLPSPHPHDNSLCSHSVQRMQCAVTNIHMPPALCCVQINRLAGLAVMLHCFLPGSWVPPLQTPSAMPDVTQPGEQAGVGISWAVWAATRGWTLPVQYACQC